MVLILCLQVIIVASLVWASRTGIENTLPVFAFFVVLMPLECRLVIPGVCDFNTMRISLLTLLVLYLTREKEDRDHRPIPLKSLMLLHVAWALVSTIYSLSVMTSFKQVISQVLEYYLLYFLFLRILVRLETIYKVVFAICMAMGVCSVISLLEAYANWSILRVFPQNLWITYNGGLDPLYIEWGRGLRVRSTFPHPILFGDALAMSIPLAIYLLSILEKKSQRVLLWICLGLMFWAIYKTSSRGPWIATCLCFVMLFVLIKNRVRKYIATIAIAGALVLACRPGVWSTVAGLYSSTTDSNSPVGASYLYRATLTDAIKTAVAKDPERTLMGYGLGTFRELGLDITFLDVTQRWYTCDNNWDAFLYETGYVGLGIIACLLFCPLGIAIRDFRRLPFPQAYLSGVFLISLAGFYFLLMSVAGYSWGQQGYLAWILIALVVGNSRTVPEQQDELQEDFYQLPEGYEQNDLRLA